MEFIQDKGIVRGRKAYSCLGCCRRKEKGYPWHLSVHKEDGIYSVRVCWVCYETERRADLGEWFEGNLAEDEEWYPLRDIIEEQGVLYAFNQIKKENEDEN